jgi:hypothetical protein
MSPRPPLKPGAPVNAIADNADNAADKGIQIEQLHASVEILMNQAYASLQGVSDEALEECLRDASWDLQRALGSLKYALEAYQAIRG